MRRSFVIGLLLAGACALSCSANEPAPVQVEIDARERFARAVALDAGSGRSLNVGSRADVLFEEGFSLVSYDPPDDFHNHAFRWMGPRGHLRLRSRGTHPMALEIVGYLNEKVIRSKAVVTAYLDGVPVAVAMAGEGGGWSINMVVPSERIRSTGWMDLFLTVSAVGFFWAEPPDLRVVVVSTVAWTEPGASH